MEAISEKTIVALEGQVNTFENTLLLMRSLGVDLSKVGEKYKGDHLYQATHILFGRNLVLLLSGYQSALTGLYGTARTLMRIILENAFLMRYFASHPDEAKSWVKDVDWYNKKRPSEIRRALFQGKLLKDYSQAYKALSSYVHPSVDGWTELLVPRGHNIVFIRYDPDYEEDLATDTLTLLLFLSKLTLKPILMSFKPEIGEVRLRDLSEIQEKIDQFLPPDTVS